MIRRLGDGSVFVAIISSRRPTNVSNMHKMIGPATWIVPWNQVAAYRECGCRNVVHGGSGLNVSRSRNVALDHAFPLGVPCVIVNDDLNWLKWVSGWELKTITFWDALTRLKNVLQLTGLKLAGSHLGTNPGFVTSEFTINTTIYGGMMLVLPTHLRFDEEQLVSEDMDFALQHYQEYGGFVRVDALLTDFQFGQAGGVQVYRNPKINELASERLRFKWGRLVKSKKNRRNAHHLVLNIPKTEMQVLNPIQ